MARRRRPPRLVRLEDRLAPAISEFLDPNPAPGNWFGAAVLPLSTGNVVITSPYDDAGGTDAGAVYLFNGKTGALISTLTGSHANDSVGNLGVKAVGNGNFVVLSHAWNGYTGAVTFGSGLTGVGGAVSAANSFVGSRPGDLVGASAFIVLANGNYVFTTAGWGNGVETSLGAVTFGSGTTGVVGVISEVNSLVGTASNDYIGRTVWPLSNGNYVVASPIWHGYTGAVTFGDGTAGVSGPVSAANSLVGTAAYDQVGSDVTTLANGNYVVNTLRWSDGVNPRVGAVTFGSGTTGVAGPISAANSLIGTAAYDQVGLGGVTGLAGGNFLVNSPNWANGAAVAAGAVTFVNGASGLTGPVTAINSLVGTTSFAGVGGGGVTALANGNYVVASPDWGGGKGAVTFGSGATGVSGPVAAANSLVGTSGSDGIGNGGVTPLTNGNYVVSSRNRPNGFIIDAGAVTLCNGTTGTFGPVTAANSLVGSRPYDLVGSGLYVDGYPGPFYYTGGVTALANGNYVVESPYWSNGTLPEAGAVTFGNGVTGVTGPVTATNSLVGSEAYQQVGGDGITPLANGNYTVRTPGWANGAAANAGAVTFGDGTAGVSGPISPANSLVGTSPGDSPGYVLPLRNGGYLVHSPYWDSGAVLDAGALTFGSATAGVTGPVSAANSLVGTSKDDGHGLYSAVELANGNFVVPNSAWDNGPAFGAGAVTFGSGVTGLAGTVSPANSLVGTTKYDSLGGVTPLANGNYVVSSSSYNNGGLPGAGVLVFGSGTTGVSGAVAAANHVAGASAGSRLWPIVVDNVNGTFYGPFVQDGGGRVRVGSQVYGFTPPKVAAVVINDGAVQRSRVTSVKVTFDQLVVLPANPADAFRLTRQSDGATPELNAAVDDTGPATVVTLTFTGATAVEAGSLADGRYTFSVLEAGINSGHFDGNGDGVPGDDLTTTLHRLFGDADGDGDTDAVDYRSFRAAFLGTPNLAFDADGDGDVDAVDFAAFRVRFGQAV